MGHGPNRSCRSVIPYHTELFVDFKDILLWKKVQGEGEGDKKVEKIKQRTTDE